MPKEFSLLGLSYKRVGKFYKLNIKKRHYKSRGEWVNVNSSNRKLYIFTSTSYIFNISFLLCNLKRYQQKS